MEHLRAAAEPARHPALVLLRRGRPSRDALRRRLHRSRPLPRPDALPAAAADTEPCGDAGRDRALGDEQAASPAGDRPSVRRQRRGAGHAVRCARGRGARVRDDLLRRRRRADAHGRAGRARGGRADGGDPGGDRGGAVAGGDARPADRRPRDGRDLAGADDLRERGLARARAAHGRRGRRQAARACRLLPRPLPARPAGAPRRGRVAASATLLAASRRCAPSRRCSPRGCSGRTSPRR